MRMQRRNRRNLLMSGLGAELEAPLLELHAASEVGPFWRAAKRLIKSALPVHFTGLYLRPEYSNLSPIVHDGIPFRTRAELQRFEELNPLSLFFDTHPKTVAARLSDFLPESELLRTEFYQGYLAREKGRYLACLCFRERQVVQTLIGLHRLREHRDFSETEMHLIEQLYPHLDVALRRVLVGRRERTERVLLETLVSHLPLAAVLLDWDLSVLFYNEPAQEMITAWRFGRRQARSLSGRAELSLPPEIYTHAHEMKARWRSSHSREDGASTPPPKITVRHRSPRGLRFTLRLAGLAPHSQVRPGILVLFEDERRAINFDNGVGSTVLSTLSCLSRREQEVALLACDGQSDKEIALALGKSAFTVKKQLHCVYRKLEICSRGKLASLLLN